MRNSVMASRLGLSSRSCFTSLRSASPTSTSVAPTQQLQSLTPLRGIAALWVVSYHYLFVYFPNLHTENYTHFFAKGYLAVDMFFLLSGFVMTHVYHRAFAENITKEYWKFLSARIARIYPLHLLVLLLFVLAALASQAVEYVATGTSETIPLAGAHSVSALVANLFMLQGLKASSLSWNYPAWSISIEFMAYLAFPFFLAAIWRTSLVSKLILTFALCAALICLAYITKDDFNQWDGPRTLLRCLPEFMLGTLLYSAFRFGAAAGLVGRDVVALGIVAATLLSLHFGAPDLLTVAIFAVLILAAVTNTGKLAAVLNVQPLVWLGDISYSLYLIHGFVQHVATKLFQADGIADPSKIAAGPAIVLTAAMLATCLLLAAGSYYNVEIAGRKYLRILLDLRRPDRNALAPATERARHLVRTH
jgi:peptidoglycan/LPS O-acetylase OafA/YrhL